ncbi:hypothetical protein [Pseudomonas chlororaphis]|uniref:hypothetical protein n=1 Tax=Pseudomonas chlororaphis TaxID=587753 RepID=UPI002367FF08|nr:hypothetical protein [Pseudomonas chlororaphis]WDG47194.1 hypothetical protein PUP58_26185 [Pseudomonas chlororaphis]
MSNRFYLSAPLDIDDWGNIYDLEHLALYEEFAERIDAAVELIREGKQHWANHQDDIGEWSADAVRILGEVRRHSYNIHQRIGLFQDDLASTIRWIIGELSVSAVTDCQYVAALAIDRACRAIEVLGHWLRDVHEDLYACDPEDVIALAEDYPDSFDVLLSEVRQERVQLEIEARESAADLIGSARHYMTLARVYASPVLSSNEKMRISANASKGGNSSAAVRQEANTGRDEDICKYGRRLRDTGRTKTEALDAILQSNAALKSPGGSEKLSRKQLGNILVKGKVFS